MQHLTEEQPLNVQCNGGFQPFGMETSCVALEEEEDRRRPTTIENDQLEAIIEADPSKTRREVAEELKVNRNYTFDTEEKSRQVGSS